MSKIWSNYSYRILIPIEQLILWFEASIYWKTKTNSCFLNFSWKTAVCYFFPWMLPKVNNLYKLTLQTLPVPGGYSRTHFDVLYWHFFLARPPQPRSGLQNRPGRVGYPWSARFGPQCRHCDPIEFHKPCHDPPWQQGLEEWSLFYHDVLKNRQKKNLWNGSSISHCLHLLLRVITVENSLHSIDM